MPKPRLSLFIDPRGRAVLHRSGFSWLAFLALPLWALHRRLWWVVLVSMPATAALHYGADAALGLVAAHPNLQGVLALVWLVGESWVMGRYANRAHAAWLRRRGFVVTATELPPAAFDKVFPA